MDSSPSWSRQYGVYTYLDVNGDKATDDYLSTWILKMVLQLWQKGFAMVMEVEQRIWLGIINDKFEPIYNFNYLNDYIPGDRFSINVDGFYNNFIIIKIKHFPWFCDEYLMLNMDTDEVYGMDIRAGNTEVDAMIFRFKETGIGRTL